MHRATVAFGLVLSLAFPYALAPDDSTLTAVSIHAAAATAAVLLVVRLLHEGLLLRRPWGFLGAGVALYPVFGVFYSYQELLQPLPFPSAVDVGYFIIYGLWAIFLIHLVSQRGPRPRRRQTILSLVDAGIFTCAGLSLVWQLLVGRYLSEFGGNTVALAAALAYPLLLSFLFGLGVHLAVAGPGRGVPGLLVLVWLGGELAADIAYAHLSLAGVSTVGHLATLPWMISYAALAALAVHPAMLRAGEPRLPRARSVWREATILAGPLTPLVVGIIVVTSDRDHVGAVLGGLVALLVIGFVLLFARLQLISGNLAQQECLTREVAEQRDQLARYAAAIASTDDSVVISNVGGEIIDWNPAAERIFGYSRDEALGRPVSMMVPPEQRAENTRRLSLVSERGSVSVEKECLRKDGSRFQASMTISMIRDESSRPIAMVGIGRDVTDRKAAEERAAQAAADMAIQAEELARLAFRDPLTGLANRALLQDRLDHSLASRRDRPLSVLLVDLDNFKQVNDVLGHAAGDELLVEIGRRLRESTREQDTVARLGGDEFAILLEDSGDAEMVAGRIVASLGAPSVIAGREVVTGASVGIAEHDGRASGAELLRRADVAMYEAKRGGRGHFERFRAEMATALTARADLESGLRYAVERDEIVVHYQPIVGVHPGQTVSFEALVRWQHNGELLSPVSFLPIAEEAGLITRIGEHVLGRSCHDLRAWLHSSSSRSLAVNVSALQMRRSRFADQLLRTVNEIGVAPSQLVIEVTESLFLEVNVDLIDQLGVLRAEGARVSVDDFGTGYSSLGRLQVLPVDAVKIDRSFVQDIHTGREDLPILTSMVVMAHNLGLDVTAEGVETATQAERLMGLGCDYLQGFYFSRPAGAADLDAAVTNTDTKMRQLILAPSDASGRQPAVLVIEDDPVTRRILIAALAGSGYRVHQAETALEGEHLASEHHPDCMLVDVHLPDGDGIELVMALRADPLLASAAIIMLTGAADRHTKMRSFGAGADDYIVKPISGPQLVTRVREVLGRRPG